MNVGVSGKWIVFMYMYNSALHSKDNMIEPGQFLKINSVSNYNTEPEMGLLKKRESGW